MGTLRILAGRTTATAARSQFIPPPVAWEHVLAPRLSDKTPAMPYEFVEFVRVSENEPEAEAAALATRARARHRHDFEAPPPCRNVTSVTIVRRKAGKNMAYMSGLDNEFTVINIMPVS